MEVRLEVAETPAVRTRWVRAAALACAALAGAAAPTLAAESGFAFLRIPVSARAAALGGTGVSYLGGAAALHANPAGLAAPGGEAASQSPWGTAGDVRLTHHEALADLRQEAAAVAVARGREALGLGFNTLYSESIEERDAVGNLIGEFGLVDLLAQLGYARAAGAWRFGGSAGYVRERLGSDAAATWELNLGALAQVTAVPGLTLGAAVQHLGPNTEFQFEGSPGEPVALPLTLQGGAALARPWGGEGSWLVAGEVRKAKDEDVTAHAGVELGYRPAAVRAGYRFGADEGEFTAGLGLAAGRFHFDYAFSAFGEALGDTHRAELGVRFGL